MRFQDVYGDPLIRLLSFLLGLLFLAALGLGVLLFTALDSAPLVQRDATVSPAAVEQARDLLRANDPRHLRPGEQRTVQIPAALIDEGLNYAATRFLHGRGGLVSQQDGAEMRLSLAVPAVPASRYLNLRASVPAAAQDPAAPAVSVGELKVPAVAVQGALTLALRVLGMESSLQLPEGVIGSVAFDPARRALLVRYTWDPALIAKLRAVALSRETSMVERMDGGPPVCRQRWNFNVAPRTPRRSIGPKVP